jgi:hypothetical protein
VPPMAVRPESKAALLRAGHELLCRKAVVAVAKLLRPDGLAAATSTVGRGGVVVSRPTAFRAWDDQHDILGDIVGDLSRRVGAKAEEAVRATKEEWAPVVEGCTFGEADIREAVCSVIKASFYAQFRSPETPAGWVLQTSAITASRIWQGHDHRPDDEWRAVAQGILDRRASLYEGITAGWAELLAGGMAAVDRRPKPGFTYEKIVKLMHSLFDGCTLRLFINRELNAEDLDPDRRAKLLEGLIDEVADAMFDLAWAYTESGSLKDPRRPLNGDAEADFCLVLEHAETEYEAEVAEGGDVAIDPDVIAAKVGGRDKRRERDTTDELRLTGSSRVIFPTSGDLADSLLRQLVVPPELEKEMTRTLDPLGAVEEVLGRLNNAVIKFPRVVEAAQTHPPTAPQGARPFLSELQQAVEHALRSPLSRCLHPRRTARRLIALALSGPHGPAGVEAVLGELRSD